MIRAQDRRRRSAEVLRGLIAIGGLVKHRVCAALAAAAFLLIPVAGAQAGDRFASPAGSSASPCTQVAS